MKIQCSCGTKYNFEVTPEMAASPVTFVCQKCGADSSEFVNELIRQQFTGQPAESTPQPSSPPPAPAVPGVVAPPSAGHGALRISREAEPVAAPAPVTESKFCARHRGEKVTQRCVICEKPICPRCIDIFGNTCSPACKDKAKSQGKAAQAQFSGSLSHEEQLWHKTGWIFSTVGIALAVFLAAWTWYAWYGSVAHSYFITRFDHRAYSGQVVLADAKNLVFLHGGTLAHYQLRNSTPLWSLELVTDQQVKDAIAQEKKVDPDFGSRQTPDDIEKEIRLGLCEGFALHVFEHNIWVSSPGKLTHYDWNNGTVLKEIPLTEYADHVTENNGDLQLLSENEETGASTLTHIDLASGEVRAEQFQTSDNPATNTADLAQNAPRGHHLPVNPSQVNGHELNPQAIAQESQNLPLPARIALPALLGNAIHNQQVQNALNDDTADGSRRALNRANTPSPDSATPFDLVVGKYDSVQMSTKLLEKITVSREAMKAPPKNAHALDNVSTANESAAINETLNDMQRSNGGDTVEEDASRYQVTLRLPNGSKDSEWTGEVAGAPWVYPLKSVNVLAAGKQVIVFDKSNHKLWDSTLANTVNSQKALEARLLGQDTTYGEGPCVEHDNTLFVADQVVLTAFDLKSGNVRWRLPSVGVVGLFFDDRGSLYVNTTSGSPDDVKYSKQIDIDRKIQATLIKVDPATGNVLWNVKPGGFISYLQGKYIYTIQTHDPNPLDEDTGDDTIRSLQQPAYMRLARIRASDGRVVWEIQRDGAPVAVNFYNNSIALVFKSRVEVLKYFTF